MKFEDCSNQEIGAEIGRLLENVRLKQNRAQTDVAKAMGLTPVSYRSLIAGKGKLENLIALIRELDCVNLLEDLTKALQSDLSPQHSNLKKQRVRKRRQE